MKKNCERTRSGKGGSGPRVRSDGCHSLTSFPSLSACVPGPSPSVLLTLQYSGAFHVSCVCLGILRLAGAVRKRARLLLREHKRKVYPSSKHVPSLLNLGRGLVFITVHCPRVAQLIAIHWGFATKLEINFNAPKFLITPHQCEAAEGTVSMMEFFLYLYFGILR